MHWGYPIFAPLQGVNRTRKRGVRLECVLANANCDLLPALVGDKARWARITLTMIRLWLTASGARVFLDAYRVIFLINHVDYINFVL